MVLVDTWRFWLWYRRLAFAFHLMIPTHIIGVLLFAFTVAQWGEIQTLPLQLWNAIFAGFWNWLEMEGNFVEECHSFKSLV